jgi:hypothetical protein
MTVETEQFPVASVRRIVVVVVIFVMDRELTQLLAVEFSSAVPTDPWKHFERLFPIGLLQLCLGAPCHVSLEEEGTHHGVILQKVRNESSPRVVLGISDSIGLLGSKPVVIRVVCRANRKLGRLV